MKIGRCMQCGNNVALRTTCGYICSNCGFEARWEDIPNFQSESKRNIVPKKGNDNKVNKIAKKGYKFIGGYTQSDENKQWHF